MKLTQFEKIESKGKIFIGLKNQISTFFGAKKKQSFFCAICIFILGESDWPYI